MICPNCGKENPSDLCDECLDYAENNPGCELDLEEIESDDFYDDYVDYGDDYSTYDMETDFGLYDEF